MTTSTTYEQRLEAAKANPQQFAQDVMALVKQHATYHDNIEWHIGDQYSCKTSHCWAGFGELLLHNASPEKPFSSQETRELIRDVLGLGKVTADYWFLSTWKIEDLEHFVKLFCDPIEEVIGSHANFKIRKGRYAEQALILASRPDLPIEWMEVLANSSNIDIASAIAQSPHIKSSIANLLINNNSIAVRLGLAANPNASIDAIRPLLKDTSTSVVLLMVRRSDLTAADVLFLAQDNSNTVRCRIAESKLLTKDAALTIKASPKTMPSGVELNPCRKIARNEILPIAWRKKYFSEYF